MPNSKKAKKRCACDTFFKKMKNVGIALNYDDVVVRTMYSDILAKDANISTHFSRRISMKIPIATAAMDTVTESKMAIEIARLGGIGVIHRNLSPKNQTTEIERVKRFLNGIIEKPITVSEDDTLEQILELREKKGYNFHTFPVLSSHRKVVVGILTRNDFDFAPSKQIAAKKAMTTDLICGDDNLSKSGAYKMMCKYKKKALPILDKYGFLSGLYIFSDLKRLFDYESMFNTDNNGRLRVAGAVGVGREALDRAELFPKDIDVVVIDTAHGDTKKVIYTIRELKQIGDFDVVAGNVTVGESAIRLAEAGADGIKVGQGPGSVCTTRRVAGIGCPQITAIYNCAKALRDNGFRIPICADGGIKYSGDIVKAIVAGAQSVMIGGLLAGCDESPGEVEYINDVRVKKYRGMGSLGAMQERGGADRYGQTNTPKEKLVPEGVESFTQYAGPLSRVINQLTGGLKSGIGYTGSKTLLDLYHNGDFYLDFGSGKHIIRP